MATYATYRHVELDHVGYGKRRVLKPPGGGSSDIFGATESGQSPRRVKTHMASSINLSDTTDSSSASSTASSDSPTPTSPGPRKDGEQAEAVTDAADEVAPLADEAAADEQPPGAGDVAGEADAGDVAAEADAGIEADAGVEADAAATEDAASGAVGSRKNYMQSNIVLGDDRPSQPKDSVANGVSTPKTNGSVSAPRSRVPPGGYSSGLW